MEMTKATKEKLKEDKLNLQTTILTLKRSMKDFKTIRKTEWKSFKTKFNDDLKEIKKSLKKLKKPGKK